MLRLWLVDEDNGAAYPVTTQIDAEKVRSDNLTIDLGRIQAEVSENIRKAARQMITDQADGSPAPKQLVDVGG